MRASWSRALIDEASGIAIEKPTDKTVNNEKNRIERKSGRKKMRESL